MTKFEIDGAELVIRVIGLDALAAFKRELRFDLTVIEGVTRGIDVPRGLSIRAPGLAVPGFKAGTYYGEDGRTFWDVHGDGTRAIAIYLRGGSPYDALFIDVEEPDDAVRRIMRAVATPR